MERRSADLEERKRGCEVVGPLRSNEEESAKHRQCYERVQNVEDKPLKNEELKKLFGKRLRDCTRLKQEWDAMASTPKVSWF